MREMSVGTGGEVAGIRWYLAVALAAGLFLGVVGPFGTYQALWLGWRVVYWVAMLLAGTLFFPMGYLLARRRLGGRGVPAWAYVPLVALLGTLPMCLMVAAITQAMLRQTLTFDPGLYLTVLAVSLPMVALQHVMVELRIRAVPRAPAADPVPPAEPWRAPEPVAEPVPAPTPVSAAVGARLLQRLPVRLGEDILCLQMEDHYVRVHTALGQELLLMRMRDAVAELDGVEGLQVHRSWWVARRAVASWSRDGKAVALTLTNGLAVPVARDRVADVRAAGWLGF